MIRSILLLLVGLAASLQTGFAKPVIQNANDLPSTSFSLEALPSELLFEEHDTKLEALKITLKADVLTILEEYTLEDAATERQLRHILSAMALLEGSWEEVLEQTKLIKELETKPAARATVGLLSTSYARAASEVGKSEGPEFYEAFRKNLDAALDALDLELTQDALQSLKSTFEIVSLDLMKGSATGALDPNARAQQMEVPRDFAASIFLVHQTLLYVPLKEIVVEVLSEALATVVVEKTDLWTPRLVDLRGVADLSPVVIGVWDSGTDPSIFGENIWRNEAEQADGTDTDGNGFIDDLHGIAFAPDHTPSTGALRSMPDTDLEQIDELMLLVKGSFDLKAGLNSEASAAFRKAISSLAAEEVLDFQLQFGRLGLYMHGTATAFTAQEQNPAAQIVFSRFDFKVQVIPDPVDEEAAERFSDHIRKTVDYFAQAGARVVNMSWRMTNPQIEASLSIAEPDPEKRRARAERIFESINQTLVETFNSHPDILFIAGAGNEDEDVEFVKSFPAGINLENVITVGAVDVSLEPAAFTSYGSSIDLYANGFEVPSKVPGGGSIKVSGTSLAAPYVANLAAKLFAIDPDLSIADVRQIMVETATTDGTNELPVIHPQAAIQKLGSK